MNFGSEVALIAHTDRFETSISGVFTSLAVALENDTSPESDASITTGDPFFSRRGCVMNGRGLVQTAPGTPERAKYALVSQIITYPAFMIVALALASPLSIFR